MPSSRITDELVQLIFCPPQPRDHRARPVAVQDVIAVAFLVVTLVLLGAAVGAEWALA